MKKTLWSSLVASLVLAANAFAADGSAALFPQASWGDNTITISARYLGGATVTFSGLGSTVLPASTFLGAATGSKVNRTYADGSVYVDSTGNADGNSRLWTYNYGSQVVGDGSLAFHSYRTESNGFSVEKDAGGSMGWEVSLGRRFGNFSKRTMWGITGGFGFTDFRTEFAGKVAAKLITITDRYSLNGRTAPNAPYSAPSTGTDGFGNSIDTTVPLGASPLTRVTTSADTNEIVNGSWKIKGGYFTMRVGPWVRTVLAKRWTVQASIGASLTYADSRYTIESQMLQLIDSEGKAHLPFNTPAELYSDQSKEVVTLGVYADLNLEYWLTPRTGLYAGLAAIQRGSFEQTGGGWINTTPADNNNAPDLAPSKAKVDLGNGVGLQMGFIHRF